MSVTEYLRELAFPLRSASVLAALLTFYAMFGLIIAANIFGVWLAAMVIPAWFRYLVMIAAARARGKDAEPPGIEFFSLAGNWWTLYPLLPIAAISWAEWQLFNAYGPGTARAFGLVAIAIYPAMMAVLIITHSPLHSLNPVALYAVMRETGASYVYAPLTLFVVLLSPYLLGWSPIWLQILFAMYSALVFSAVTGAVTRHRRLIDNVYIDEAQETDADTESASLLSDRMAVLNHAYGFVSRGNRDGGLGHIYDWLQTDPAPDAGWAWFFDAMMRWERNQSALFFAQRYLSRLLAVNDPLRANKVILRCRLVDKTFRPLADDLPAAIAAAERGGNAELLASLKRL